MVIGGFDITDKYIRARQIEPSEFEANTMRTIRMTSGIKAIVGRKKGEKTTTVQSILFDKKQYSEEQAKKWLERHNDKFSEALDLEIKKSELFQSSHDMMYEDHLTGHLPQLSESQIKKLLELAGPADSEEVDTEEDDSEDMQAPMAHPMGCQCPDCQLKKYMKVV